MLEATHKINQENRSLRSVAKEMKICPMSLHRFVKRHTSGAAAEFKIGYKRSRQVFSDDEERELVKCLKESSVMYFGLSPKQVQRLTLKCALVHNKNIPAAWRRDEMAGCNWFSAFMKQNPTLSIRSPQSTSIARSMAFNRPVVKVFFDKLAETMDRYKFNCSDVRNMDETGVTTVSKPSKVVAGKGSKQVGAVASAERGALVTVACAVNAIGHSIPPMFIFPRVNYYDHFLRDGPIGSAGCGNKSGWMTEDEFLQFMKHFVRHVRATKDMKVLLLLDNHASHLSIKTIDYARDNGVVMLTFPPHCSHKLQPLDRSVYGPFK